MNRPDTTPDGLTGAGVEQNRPQLLQTALLPAILLVALGLRVACALLFKNINHSDEIFQYLEPAHRAVFGYGLVAPEFQSGARSWLVPGLNAGIMWLASRWSDNPAVYLDAIGVVMSALSLVVVVVAFYWGRRLYGMLGAATTGGLAATWIELVYFAPKPLTDVLAGDALVVAIFLVYPEIERRSRNAFFLCGLCLGVALAIRWQLAPIYVLTALYLCRGWIKQRWLPLIIGGTGPVLAAGLLDALTWKYPFQSVVLPLLTGYSAGQSEPWYYYIGVLTLDWSGALVPLIALACLGARRMPFLGVLAVSIIVLYSMLGLKVYRYIYPALPFIVILAGLGTSETVVRLRSWYPRREPALVIVAVGGWMLTSASLAVSDHFRILLTKDGAIVDAFDRIGKEADLCGLAVVRMEWWYVPGYVHLHRNVPLYSIPSEEIARQSESFNYLIGAPQRVGNPSPFSRESCAPNAAFSKSTAGEICIYHRPGGCVPSTQQTLQSQM
jgi:phosphatidylinositol glycan class B